MMDKMPVGWEKTTLGNCLEFINGRAYKREEMLSEGTPILRIQNLNRGDKWFYSDLELHEDKYCDKGDLLYAWSATFGPYIWWGRRSIYHYHIWKIKFTSHVEKKFAFYLLKEITQEIKNAAHGVAMPHMTKSGMEKWSVPLPPLNEQRRIVAKIEALTAHSKRAREALEDIPTLIEQFKQSVLAAAFRGDLTADWREKNPDVEPASKLLERIRGDRRAQWEATELAKMRAKGKEPKNDKWKEKYREPIEPFNPYLDSFPENWTLVSIDELANTKSNSLTIGPFGSNLKVVDYRDDGIPLVFVREIRAESFGDMNTKFISPTKAEELKSHAVEPGDLLITKMGDPPGDTAIYPENFPSAIITADCIKLSPDKRLISSDFLKFWLRTTPIKNLILGETKGVAQQKLSLKRFRTIAIPLPPIEEQQNILSYIENQLHSIDNVQKISNKSGEDVNFLDQSILSKAFRGELVPQDPNDEPADLLLDRIRAEREKLTPKKKTKRSRKKKSTQQLTLEGN